MESNNRIKKNNKYRKMKTFFDKNFKYIITAIILIWLTFNVVDMFVRTNGMSQNDKERIVDIARQC